MEKTVMKQFLYLDHDIVNSIVAQSGKGFITEYSQETEHSDEHTSGKKLESILGGEAGASVWKLANATAKLDIEGALSLENGVSSSSRELVTKTLHDAAFDMAYNQINPTIVSVGNQNEDDYGVYVELKRVFNVVDFDYLENIFSKGGLVEFIKKTEKEKIEAAAGEATSGLNRTQARASSAQFKAEIKKALAASSKQYDDMQDIIGAIKQLVPYNRMLISSDGYLIPLEDTYFRINPKNLGFKYGGEITCVGMITNIIGENADPNNDNNVFETLQFSVNEILRGILPTSEKNLCVVHPIAVYYGK